LFCAIAACAVEARDSTPSWITARSGTARTSALAVTVILRVDVSWALAGVSEAWSARTTNGTHTAKRVML
jgi:hypothetical protein